MKVSSAGHPSKQRAICGFTLLTATWTPRSPTSSWEERTPTRSTFSLLIGQTTHGFQKGKAQPIRQSKPFPIMISCASSYSNLTSEMMGSPDTDAKVFNGILITYCADINHQILNRNIVPAVTLRSGHKMRRFCLRSHREYRHRRGFLPEPWRRAENWYSSHLILQNEGFRLV